MASWRVYVTKFSGADGSVLWTRKLLDEQCAAAVVPGWRSGLHVAGGVVYADVAANPLTSGLYLWGTSGPSGHSTGFAVARVGLDGTKDPSFGTQVLTFPGYDGGHSIGCIAGFVCGYSEGRLLACGTAPPNSSGDPSLLFVARFLISGALDPTFGTSGLVAVAPKFPADATGYGYWYNQTVAGLRVIPDGSGKFGLWAQDYDEVTQDAYGFLFDASGTQLSSFKGASDPALPSDYSVTAGGRLADGRFLALPVDAGNFYPFLAAYDTGTGAISQKVTLPGSYAPQSISTVGQTDGKFLLLAFVGTTMTLTRYTALGAVDWTLTRTLAFSSPSADVAVGSDGKIMVAALNSSTGALVLYRFLASGAADTTYGTAGVVTATVSLTGINVAELTTTGVALSLL